MQEQAVGVIYSLAAPVLDGEAIVYPDERREALAAAGVAAAMCSVLTSSRMLTASAGSWAESAMKHAARTLEYLQDCSGAAAPVAAAIGKALPALLRAVQQAEDVDSEYSQLDTVGNVLMQSARQPWLRPALAEAGALRTAVRLLLRCKLHVHQLQQAAC